MESNEKFGEIFEAVFESAESFLDAYKSGESGLPGKFSGLTNEVGELATGGFETFQDIATSLKEMGDAISTEFPQFKETFEAMKGTLESIFEDVKTFVKENPEAVESFVQLLSIAVLVLIDPETAVKCLAENPALVSAPLAQLSGVLNNVA